MIYKNVFLWLVSFYSPFNLVCCCSTFNKTDLLSFGVTVCIQIYS